MNKQKNGHTNGHESLSEADRGYYEDMYKDLPKEVVDILMKTHPLMGKNDDLEATAYRTRRPQRDDLEEIREARMQQVSNEIDALSNAPQQEGDPTRYAVPRSRSSEQATSESSEEECSAPVEHTVQEEYDDGIQYVSMVPPHKKRKIVEEAPVQKQKPSKKRKHFKRESITRDEAAYDTRYPYTDMDFEAREKQEHLDNLCDEEYEEEATYDFSENKMPILLGAAAVLVVIILIFRMVSLGSQLQEAKEQLSQIESYKEKYEEIQLEKMQLQEQLEDLGVSVTTDNKTGESTKKETATGSTTEYTVVEGDTVWKIAAKTLGNGAEYKKILEANGLSENSDLQIGAKLKIPK